MKKKILSGVFAVTTAFFICAPVLAQAETSNVRTEKLEERVRDLEARMAKVEASSQKQMGMMMQHGQKMGGPNMGNTNPAMGQMPQQVPQQPAQQAPGMNMPQGNAQGGGMPAGGMGDM